MKHDMTNPTYRSWQAMRTRCNGTGGDRSVKEYLERGITYTFRWNSFEAFVADLGERPEGTTLDRKDNTKGYYKENCRWATPSQQQGNTKRTVITAWRRDFIQYIRSIIPGSDRAIANFCASLLELKVETVREVLRRRQGRKYER